LHHQASAVEEIAHGAFAIQADIANLAGHAEIVEKVAGRYGRLDVLFVNAGGGTSVKIEDCTEADWEFMFGVNLKGMYFMVQKALPLMPKGSSIVLTSSLAARRALPGLSVYGAAKAGVSSLARSLGAELVGRTIRVNVVSPGPIDTGLLERGSGIPADVLPGMKHQIAAQNPMQRWGTAEEVAGLVLFLASNEASFITGTDTLVDGGIGSF
jgi:NAD(P)-dependent dehydrogenase (short-subunit alcohol dehydrogenase family)